MLRILLARVYINYIITIIISIIIIIIVVVVVIIIIIIIIIFFPSGKKEKVVAQWPSCAPLLTHLRYYYICKSPIQLDKTRVGLSIIKC